MSTSLVSNFKTEALFGVSKEIRKNSATEMFGNLLDGVSEDWIPVFSIFSKNVPLKYWNPDLVVESLGILTANKNRTFEAIDYHNGDLDIAFSNLTKSIENIPPEERIELTKT